MTAVDNKQAFISIYHPQRTGKSEETIKCRHKQSRLKVFFFVVDKKRSSDDFDGNVERHYFSDSIKNSLDLSNLV